MIPGCCLHLWAYPRLRAAAAGWGAAARCRLLRLKYWLQQSSTELGTVQGDAWGADDCASAWGGAVGLSGRRGARRSGGDRPPAAVPSSTPALRCRNSLPCCAARPAKARPTQGCVYSQRGAAWCAPSLCCADAAAAGGWAGTRWPLINRPLAHLTRPRRCSAPCVSCVCGNEPPARPLLRPSRAQRGRGGRAAARSLPKTAGHGRAGGSRAGLPASGRQPQRPAAACPRGAQATASTLLVALPWRVSPWLRTVPARSGLGLTGGEACGVPGAADRGP